MTHYATIVGTDHLWGATLPDQIHLSQGPVSDTDPFPIFLMAGGKYTHFDNATQTVQPVPPLVIDIHYTPEVLFGAAHGIATASFRDFGAEGLAGETDAADYTDVANGVRGPVVVRIHNDLGVPLHATRDFSQGGSMALFLNGFNDMTQPTTEFHTKYTHFHGLAAATPAGVATEGQVGAGGGGLGAQQGNPTDAPDWISISADIAPGGTLAFGAMTLHERDLPNTADDFSLSFMLLAGGIAADDLAALRAKWDADHTLPTIPTVDTGTIFTANPNARPPLQLAEAPQAVDASGDYMMA